MRVNWDEAAPGLTYSLRALAGNAAGKGYDDQLTLESQLAQRLAAIRASDANAALDAERQREVQARTQVILSRPELAKKFGASVAGMSPAAFDAGAAQRDAGMPLTVDDPAAQMNRFAKPAEQRKFESGIAQALALQGDADWNPAQIAQARGAFQDQDRTSGMVAGDVDPIAVWKASFANKGANRYGVQGDEMIDQFAGFGGQTTQGKSKITENLAQAGAAGAQAARTKQATTSDKTALKDMVDDQGNPILVRVPVQGAPGPVNIPGTQARPRRDPDDVQLGGEYTREFGTDPYLRPKGAPGPAEYIAAARRFARDPQVAGATRGVWIPGQGFEVKRNGKLVGYYD